MLGHVCRGANQKTGRKHSESSLISPIFEHIRTLCNYKESYFEYDYFAHLVQKPWELPHVSLKFITAEGVGKDIFISYLNNEINEKYTYNTEKLDLVCGKFNSTLGGKLLITLNETNLVDSRDRIENLKYLITAKKVTIEGRQFCTLCVLLK